MQTMVEMRAIVISVVLALAALPTAHSLPSRVVVDAPLRTRTKQTTVKVFIIAGQSNAVGMAETNSTNHTTGQPQNGSLIYQVRPHRMASLHAWAGLYWAALYGQQVLHMHHCIEPHVRPPHCMLTYTSHEPLFDMHQGTTLHVCMCALAILLRTALLPSHVTVCLALQVQPPTGALSALPAMLCHAVPRPRVHHCHPHSKKCALLDVDQVNDPRTAEVFAPVWDKATNNWTVLDDVSMWYNEVGPAGKVGLDLVAPRHSSIQHCMHTRFPSIVHTHFDLEARARHRTHNGDWM